MMANTSTHVGSDKKMAANPGAAARAGLRHRDIYVRMRLVESQEEMKSLVSEKKSFGEKLRSKPAAGDQLKNLLQRRIYVTARIDALRAERQHLQTEKKTIAVQMKGAR
ncbi:MAG: hypothetical protein K2Y27_11535 [Xanthobacteraceae bacterium]|nr:hypothetical protein [Xanthobacteraceae bacterium]